MAQPIITRFVKGSDAGAVETNLLAGAYLKTVVKSAEGHQLTLTFENADETTGSVSFRGAAAVAQLFEQSARVPAEQQTAIVYVPRDYVDGDPEAQTVTVGQFDEFGRLYYGFATDDIGFGAYGAFPGRRDIIGIHGPASADGTTFTLDFFETFNLGLMRDIAKVEINGAEYNVGPVRDFEGAYRRSIVGVPALPVATADFEVNFIFADAANYYRNGVEVLHKAGLYLWNKDLTPAKYEFVGVNSRIIFTAGDPPLPSAENDGALVISPNGVYQYFSEPIHRVEPVVAWGAYAAPDYHGAYNSDDRIGDANDFPANTRYYNTSRRRFRVRSAIAGTGPQFIYRWVDTNNPANSIYPFHHHSRDDAATHATAIGQVAFTGYRVEVVTAYAAAQPASTAYHSRRLLFAGEELAIVVHRAAVPSAAEANFDTLYGLGAEETDSLHFKRRSELDELYLRADNLVASSFHTHEIVGFLTAGGVLFHAGGSILPAAPAWLVGITQEFAIGGASYEVTLQTNGEGPLRPANANVRMDVNAIGSDAVTAVALAKSPDGNAWTAVLDERLFTAGERYRVRLHTGARLRDLPVGLGAPSGMTVFNGRLLIADNDGDELYEVDPDGADAQGVRLRSLPAGLASPLAMTVYAGRLLVADNDRELYEIDPDGADGQGVVLRTIPRGVVTGMAVYEGRLLVADPNTQTLAEIDPDGENAQEVALRSLADYSPSPTGMTVFDGRLLVADNAAANGISEVDPDGADDQGAPVHALPAGLGGVQGMAVYEGRVLVVDSDGDLWEIHPDRDAYLATGTEDHVSKLAGDHEVDELEGEVRAEIKAQRTALDGEVRAKADVDLQNVSAALSDAQQGTVRNRIGAASAATRGQIQTKGEIWATTPNIPDVPVADRVAGAGLPFAPGERWSVTQHAPAGVVGDDTDLLSHQLEGLPLIAPAGVEGFWIELLLDGVLTDDVRVPWGNYPVPSATGGEFNATFLLKTADNRGIRANIQIHLASNAHQINLAQTGTTIPANTRIRIREARPSFPAVGGTRPGVALGPRVGSISTSEGLERPMTNGSALLAGGLGDQTDGNARWAVEADALAGFVADGDGDTPATEVARLVTPRLRPGENVTGFIARAWARPTYGTLAAALPVAGLSRFTLNMTAAPLRPVEVGTKLRINREIIEVTALTASANLFTVARARDGTAEAAHVAGVRASGVDLELYDDTDFEWGPGNIYNSNEGGGRNSAISPLKLDTAAAVLVRYITNSASDDHYIELWGRGGSAPVGSRIDIHLKIETVPESDIVDGRLNGLGDPAADGSDDDKVGITNDGLHHVHISTDVPPVRTWLLSGPTSSQQVAEQTDGVTSTGAGHFHFRFYRASPVDPGTRNDWLWGDDGFGRSPTVDLWNPDREIVEQGNSDNHPIWVLIGSATRSASGTYSYTPWHTHAEFGAPLYSVEPDADSVARHPVKTAADNWLWLRDASGGLVGPIPLTDRNYSRQLLFNEYVYISTPGAHNTKPFARDLSVYDAMLMEIRPYVDYDSDPAAPCSALLFRPDDGFLVARAAAEAENRYQVRAWDQYALKIIGGDSPVRDDDFLVSALGEYKIHFRFIFKVAGANSDDRHISDIVAFDHGALYNRCRLVVWGIRF